MNSEINKEMLKKFEESKGFIAALDQSGGSTPKALAGYGIESFANDDEMFKLIHAMRERVISSEVFDGDRISGAILFEDTLSGTVEGIPTAKYFWQEKGIVPFIKIDKGLEPLHEGVQLLKPIPGLDKLLISSKEKGVFGTKMRSLIKEADLRGVLKVVEQQFDVAKEVLKYGMVPIIEPEIDINAKHKGMIEKSLRSHLYEHLNRLDDESKVILKLTLPESNDFYKSLVNHPNVLKVVALSGGYSRNEANMMLSGNKGVIASFSRALLSELRYEQSETEFDAVLNAAIESIYTASNKG